MKDVKIQLTILILIITFSTGKAQNLIPDEKMTQLTSTACEPVYLALGFSEYWYGAGSSTVDLFIGGCIHDLNDTGSNPWTFATYPNSSNGFLGIWGIIKTDSTRVSELVATPLVEPLNAGQFYHFSIDTRYRGVWHQNETLEPVHCRTVEPRSLEVFTSTDFTEMQTIEAELGEVIDVVGENVLTLNSGVTTDSIPTFNWGNLNGCFEAQGGERHLGIGLSMGNYEGVFPCDSNRIEEDFFSLYYFNLDNVKLIPFPTATTDTLLLCSERGKVDLDITTYFYEDVLDFVAFEWQDGHEGTTRTFTKPGYYYFDAIVECGRIPFEIYIEEKRCEAITFVPTAFTPNFDGRNDELFPYFGHDFPIMNFEFMIFDRWGNLFYRSTVNDGFTGWNGTVNGKSVGVGTYVWSLKFDLITPEGTKHYQLSDDVLLVR